MTTNNDRIKQIENQIVTDINRGGCKDGYSVSSLMFGWGLSQSESEELMMSLHDNYRLTDGTRIGD